MRRPAGCGGPLVLFEGESALPEGRDALLAGRGEDADHNHPSAEATSRAPSRSEGSDFKKSSISSRVFVGTST